MSYLRENGRGNYFFIKGVFMKRYIVIASLAMMVSCCMVAMEPQERRERTRDPQPQRGWEQPTKQGEILRIRGRGNTVTYLDTATGKSTTYDIVEDRKKQKRSHRSKRRQKREELPAISEEAGRSTQEEEIIDPETGSYDSSI
jgi:hypothetical protein